jgi:hypothetical protein
MNSGNSIWATKKRRGTYNPKSLPGDKVTALEDKLL